MALVFLDSFDHYLTQTDKWDSAGSDCTIRLNTGQARTGIGCLEVNSGAFGPERALGAHYTDLLLSTAWYSSSSGNVLWLDNLDASGGFSAAIVGVVCNPARSLSVVIQPNGGAHQFTAGTTADAIVAFNSYNQIALRFTYIAGTKANAYVWCNGVLVLTVLNINMAPFPGVGFTYTNGIRLMGPGGSGFTCFHDDVFCFDCSTGANADFPGGFPRIFAAVPFANGAPVAWTPLASTNFSQVKEIPPDNDTSYNSSATVGQQDQYQFNATGVPASSQLLALQMNLDMEVDSGARSVASSVGSNTAAAVALTAGYHDYTTPYDVNPNTGVSFVAADFPFSIGPKVTA